MIYIKKLLTTACIVLLTINLFGQNLSTRTNSIKLSFENGRLEDSESLPVVTWENPAEDYTSSESNQIFLNATVTSNLPLIRVTMSIGEEETNRIITTKELKIAEDTYSYEISQSLWLPDGTSFVKISATNTAGATVLESRSILVGENAFENVLAMNRKDYALFFATDRYEEWDDLVNPIDDAHSIAKELEEIYGFQVEVVENATKEQVWSKIRSYADIKYNPQDQLMIFFAGHGQYDDTFGEGYVVPTDAKSNDQAKTSYISHNRLRNNIDNLGCKHVLLAMDVCFGGTFDPVLARSRALEDYSVSTDEMVVRKLSMKTRKYITSGGKEYVSDGIPGQHSPFAAKIIQSLRTRGGPDRILTLSELKAGMENLALIPRFGSFGSDESMSDFVFISN